MSSNRSASIAKPSTLHTAKSVATHSTIDIRLFFAQHLLAPSMKFSSQFTACESLATVCSMKNPLYLLCVLMPLLSSYCLGFASSSTCGSNCVRNITPWAYTFVPSLRLYRDNLLARNNVFNRTSSLDSTQRALAEAKEPTLQQKPHLMHLEYEPYYNQASIPQNKYKRTSPLIGRVLRSRRLDVNGPDSGGVYELVVNHGGNLPYHEGQSIGIIPPGLDLKTEKPYAPRLYSVASTRYGDDFSGNTVSFCIRILQYVDPETNQVDPSKCGVCSNYVASLKEGDEVTLTGPVGKLLLLPEEEPSADLIMVATGTGVAPFRSFLRRLFREDTPAARAFTGKASLFFGVPYRSSLLYSEEFEDMKRMSSDKFDFDVAISREMKNKEGGKLYVQHLIAEKKEEIIRRLLNGAHIYFCGLKNMMPGILEVFSDAFTSSGLDWDKEYKSLKKSKKWHMEVY